MHVSTLLLVLLVAQTSLGDVSITSRWGDNVKAKISVPVKQDIQGGWKMTLQFQEEISTSGFQIWRADVVSNDGKTVVLKNKSWNGNLQSGTNLEMEFIFKIVVKPEVVSAVLEANGPNPATEGPQPITEGPQPITEGPQPITEGPQPITEGPQPITNAPNPVTEAPNPVTVTSSTGTVGGGPSGFGLHMYKYRYSGEATYYGGTTGGTCSLARPGYPAVAKSSKIKYMIALNNDQFAGSRGCGMCFKVTGHGKGLGGSPVTGEFYVFVDNLCPECKTGDVDLGTSGDGRWEIDIQAVQCPVGDGKLQYVFQGSNTWYLKLQVRNERVPVTEVKVWDSALSSFKSMTRTADNFWLLPSDYPKPVKFPLKIQLKSVNGFTVSDHVPKLENEVVLDGSDGVQFPLDSSLPSA